ncbi:hypothetical protein NESM_000535100 [Novymonas esmeraldas]|uniref:Uncharacterized protein n=1 Tax=Novymonas esmeraldas TaxID=1808958 RepID=A0AAW0ERX6_9TRYP
MAVWGPLLRQLMAYSARHPQLQRAMRDAGQRVSAHPVVKKATQRIYAAFETSGAKAAHAGTHSATANAGAGAGGRVSGDTIFSRWRHNIGSTWHKHKARVLSFAAANFMAILVFLQMGPMLWHWTMRGVRSLTGPPPSGEEERKERRRKRKAEAADEQPGLAVVAPDDSMRDAILQSVPPPRTTRQSHSTHDAPVSKAPQPWQALSVSSSLYDDTQSASQQLRQQHQDVQKSFNDMHQDLFRTADGAAQINFETSFLVKMGDETTFTSSLEREALTGAVSARS